MTVPVHLRIREVDQLIPKSLYPSTSANTYWQIEAESSILYGEFNPTLYLQCDNQNKLGDLHINVID